MPSLIDLQRHGWIKAVLNGSRGQTQSTIIINRAELEAYWNSVDRQVLLDMLQSTGSGHTPVAPSTQPQAPVNPVGAQGNAGNPGYGILGSANPGSAAPSTSGGNGGAAHPVLSVPNPNPWSYAAPHVEAPKTPPAPVIRDADGKVISREAINKVMGWKS